MQASTPNIADFLLYLFKQKCLAPITIEVYKTAIAGAIKYATGVDFRTYRVLSALIHSFIRERPRALRTHPPRNLYLVLFCLSQAPFEPLDSVPLKLLTWRTWRTVFLLLHASVGISCVGRFIGSSLPFVGNIRKMYRYIFQGILLCDISCSVRWTEPNVTDTKNYI